MSIADPTPVQVDLGPATTLAELSCGYMFCVARSDAGVIYSWGSHTNGKLGMNLTSPVCSPTPPPGFGTLQHPFAGGEHACALDTQGIPSCWGYNLNGQLGNGTNTDTYQPSQVVSTGVLYVTMDLGAGHTCALDFNGSAWCWGTNTSGENGTGDSATVFSRNSPARIETFSRQVVRLSAGYDFSCAIVDGGALYCWGQNMSGQLGIGNQLTQDVPTPVLIP
jgi:alpha-tubulin suppressor-like RCC1 family protein